MALNAISRDFGDHGVVPDCIKCSKYVQRDSPELMSKIMTSGLQGDTACAPQLTEGISETINPAIPQIDEAT